jgi:glycosyltransferase involved in cell wall biosynthesis
MMAGGASSGKLTAMHVVAGLHPSSGGPSRTVVQLADALASRPDVDIMLLSQTLEGDPVVASGVSAVDRRMAASSSPLAIRLSLPIRQELKRMPSGRHPSVMHSHGLWNPANHWASRAARCHGIPLVVHPRGMLEPWALQHKAWKKRIGMALYQRQDLETANILIATSPLEYENIRKLGLRQPIALIPNGVALGSSHDVEHEPHRYPERARSVLFLSRVHPKKGLLNLIQAWAGLAPHNWRPPRSGDGAGATARNSRVGGLPGRGRWRAEVRHLP